MAVHNTYEVSLTIIDGEIKVIPHEKEGSGQSYQATLNGFSRSLNDCLNENRDYFKNLLVRGLSEEISDFLELSGTIYEYFEHECFDPPIIEEAGSFSSSESPTYNLTISVTDPSSTTRILALTD